MITACAVAANENPAAQIGLPYYHLYMGAQETTLSAQELEGLVRNANDPRIASSLRVVSAARVIRARAVCHDARELVQQMWLLIMAELEKAVAADPASSEALLAGALEELLERGDMSALEPQALLFLRGALPFSG